MTDHISDNLIDENNRKTILVLKFVTRVFVLQLYFP